MNTNKTLFAGFFAIALVAGLTGCATTTTKAPAIADNLRTSLNSAGLKDVSVTEDRDKGVITLGGHVVADQDKAQAESIAKSLAGAEVVANQIAVVPVGLESQTKEVNADLDKGIDKNLDAALLQAQLHDNVKFTVKNHVVTLSGEVNSQDMRARVGAVALAVPNVQQVVNELQVKDQKATSSK